TGFFTPAGPADPPAAPAAPGPGPRTALVHDWLTGMRGGEKVLEAVAELYPQAPIHTLFHFPGRVSPALEAHPIHTSFLQGWPGVAGNYRRWLPLFPAAIEDFDLSAYDVIVSTSHCVAKGAIPAPGAVHVCYCHSPMRYAWDQEHAYFPRRRGPAARLRGLALTALRAWDTASAPRVDHFVANSRFVARRIRRYYGRQADVLPPPVETEFFTPGDADGGGAGADYCLVVAALAPYKRVDVAAEACARLGLELRVVGDGPDGAALRRRFAAGGRVRFLGRVDAEALRRLYRGALALLQPGVEDFGIAPVEALACGTPVVALGRGGVTDIVEDGVHGVLYGGGASGGGADGVGGLAPLTDPVSELAAAIDKCRQTRFNTLNLRARAEEFSRERFRSRFANLMNSIVGETRPPVPGRPPSQP
ncbi:MAG TPA: glycosyltransferase, partial [Thermoanaerobaculia bacterium]|nr:glycosyltransferase [Thermoanaerobaculia bacterium]